NEGDQPFHEREGFNGGMLDLRAVLPFNDGPFLLRRFGLLLEHREEPRRATRIAVPVLHRLWMLKGSRHRPAMASLSVCNTSHIWTFAPSALFVHCFCGFGVKQHIRRPTTRRLTVGKVYLRQPG